MENLNQMLEIFAWLLMAVLPLAGWVAWRVPALPPLGIFQREDLSEVNDRAALL